MKRNPSFIGSPRGGVICGDSHFSVCLSGISAWGLRWSDATPGAWVMWIDTAIGNVASTRAVCDDFGNLVGAAA